VSSSQLQIGDEWLDKIRSSLTSAKIVIALFSPESVQRPWVNFEAGGAWFSQDKKLMPLCIGGLHPATLPKPYSNIQGTELDSDYAAYYLIQAIWNVLKLPGMTPPPFSDKDEDVDDLVSSLGRLDAQKRALASMRRIRETWKED
jgi:hypothetical protein